MAAASSPAATDENEEQAKTKSTSLLAIWRNTGYLYGSVVEENSPKCAYAVASMTTWLRELGHRRLILQSDDEPALCALRDAAHAKYLFARRAPWSR